MKGDWRDNLHFLTLMLIDEAKWRLARLVRCALNRRAACVKGWCRVDLEEFGNLETAVEETESVFARHVFKRMRG